VEMLMRDEEDELESHQKQSYEPQEVQVIA